MTRRLDQQLQARQSLDRASHALGANMTERVLLNNPGDLTARVIEARAKLAMCRPDEALDSLEAAFAYSQYDGPRADADMLRAEALLQCDYDDLAATQIDHLRRRFPDDVRCHRLAAELAIKQQRHGDAIAALKQIVRLEPSNTAARGLLARYIADDDPNAAFDWLEHNAHDAARRLELARLCRRVDRLADAEAHYAALLETHVDDAHLWREAAQVAMLIGHDAAAVNRLNHAVAVSDAGDNTALHALATAHMQAGRFAPAARCWWRATRRDDMDVRAWAGLMICCHCRDRVKPARRAATKLEKHSSKSERRRILAELWQHAAGGRVIAQTVGASEGHEHHAAFNRLLHRAAKVLGDQLEEHSRRADTHYHRAVCLAALGLKEDADAHLTEALAINPDYEAARKLAA
jgi:tetratricopeptide (TPR) repeat protein